jgi:hypothetical protein
VLVTSACTVQIPAEGSVTDLEVALEPLNVAPDGVDPQFEDWALPLHDKLRVTD